MYLNLNNSIVERKSKTVYKDGEKVIKLFVEDYSESLVLNEALNQAKVEEYADLDVPKLLEVRKVDNRWAIISEYIEGMPLDMLMKKYPEKIDEYLNKFVEIQLNILTNTVPLLNRLKDKFKRKLEEDNTLDEHLKFELMQRLEGMKNHTKLCHGDFNPSNIIIKDNGDAYVIDWAHVTAGNASADAAQTFLLFIVEDQEELAYKYLDLFSEKSGIDKHNIQRWIPIVSAIGMAKCDGEKRKMLEKWADIKEYE